MLSESEISLADDSGLGYFNGVCESGAGAGASARSKNYAKVQMKTTEEERKRIREMINK